MVTPREDDPQVFGKDGTVMVYIPAGEFQMGSTDEAIQAAVDQCVADGLARDRCEGSYDDEQPVHPVALDAFWMGQTEVSVAQFREFVQAVGYRTEAERQGWGWVLTREAWEQVEGANWQHPDGPDSRTSDEHPVVQVSWNDATAYCAWVGARLPTEAEWAYAARGPGGRIYPWGDAFECARGNFDDETRVDAYVVPGGTGCDGYVRTAPVGSYPTGASPYGVLDMAGNVWEWVADWYGIYPEGRQVNPTGPEMGASRVVRGGAFITGPNVLRAANRYHHEPAYRCNEIGFRCVTADPPLE
jgi:formylglycine-generating enzyme required for sulfatase activity